MARPCWGVFVALFSGESGAGAGASSSAEAESSRTHIATVLCDRFFFKKKERWHKDNKRRRNVQNMFLHGAQEEVKCWYLWSTKENKC